jgi:hypothetical protein
MPWTPVAFPAASITKIWPHPSNARNKHVKEPAPVNSKQLFGAEIRR